MITIAIWSVYLTLEGLYDALLYRFLPIKHRTYKGIHVPHALALLQRMLILSSLLLPVRYEWQFLVDVVALILMLPMLQTGAYMEAQAILPKLNKELPVLLDARRNPYGYFSYAHKESSRFPDKNPYLRVGYFVIGIVLYCFIN